VVLPSLRGTPAGQNDLDTPEMLAPRAGGWLVSRPNGRKSVCQRCGGGMARVSIADVALEVGVSQTTVSHAFSGKRPVSDETLARVLEAGQRLGYRPSHVARSLRGQRTHTTALIVPDLCNPFYPAMARGLQDVLAERGYQTFVCDADSRTELEDRFIEDALARQVDGIVIAPLLGSVPPLLLAASGVPVVVASSHQDVAEAALRQPHMDTVSSHDELGMRQAAEHLLRAGHRRIGFITAPLNIGPAQRRFDGYRNALAAAGCDYDDDLLRVTAFTQEGGANGLAGLLDTDRPPTAVLCANDLIATGALRLAADRQIRVPDALAVVGYDDIDLAALVTPRLTTVRNPTRDIGKACGDLLLDRMTGAYAGAPREVRVATALIVRESG
jgi:DNA-binding LacI/PurR family transcriptional regulator